MPAPRLAQLGEIMQIAFVPEDFDGTIQAWIAKGAGPFYVLRGRKAGYHRCYGEEAYPELDIALGHWGDMQIEIVAQRNDVRSIYSEWRRQGREGVHHTCIVVNDLDEARAACAALNTPIVIEGQTGDTRWIYADPGDPGGLLEIIQYGESSRRMMQMIRDSARDWDGSDPIRTLG